MWRMKRKMQRRRGRGMRRRWRKSFGGGRDGRKDHIEGIIRGSAWGKRREKKKRNEDEEKRYEPR